MAFEVLSTLVSRGYVFTDTANAFGRPNFLDPDQRKRWDQLEADRYHVYKLPVTSDGAGTLHIFQCVDMAGVAISLTAGRHAWAVLGDNKVPIDRLLRVFKYIRDSTPLSWTVSELIADAGADAVAVKGSHTFQRPTAWDVSGNPTAWAMELHYTVPGFDHTASFAGTTTSEVTSATAEAF